jgi:lipoate-protein ligase A
MASFARPRSVVGALSASGLVSRQVPELYDYDKLRAETAPLMFVVRAPRPTLVLGSSQREDILKAERLGDMPLRRRRGGGGLVLLQPDDLWVDWWIPADDARWSPDVHVSALQAGAWWRSALSGRIEGDITVHDGPLEGDPAYRLVCFAGSGPGEVFVDAKKAVGITQWRVREGMFLSSVLPTHSSTTILELLKSVPEGLSDALEHHVLSSLGEVSSSELLEVLRVASGPWTVRPFDLTL